MKRATLLIVTLSALLFGEQKLNLMPPQDSLSLSDTLTVEPLKKHRTYNYRYQVVSGVAMMLFFGVMLGATQSMNPR